MNYPFTAIVGQEKLKKALLLCAINPGIGGVLIQGDKGTAKSTAARALADIVPAITKINNCSFGCLPTEPLDFCDACQQQDKQLIQGQVPFINLPLGATEERVLGNLDLEQVLIEKKKKLQPGLLAAAHQGVLYVDEVNLLADHLVDVLLDVSVTGENVIEREGLSLSHPARFTLIGTMNPEEGYLRPQFLDRFGLMVEVEAPVDIAERTEVVRRRIAFERDQAAFVRQWESAQSGLQNQLIEAKKLLSLVQLNDELLTLISELTTELNVKSLRADIVIYKTAVTIAALNQRTEVSAEDIREAANLALAHRSKKHPFNNAPNKQDKPKEQPNHSPDEQTSQQKPTQAPVMGEDSFKNPASSNGNQDLSGKDKQEQPIAEQVFEASEPLSLPQIKINNLLPKQSEQNGRRGINTKAVRGLYTNPELTKNTTDIAVDATVLHALVRNPDGLDITIDDLHRKKRNGKSNNLILFVVDASGSMAASKRMEAVKGTVIGLLTDAYQKRDTVGVIAFRGIEAQILLNPTQSVELAEQAMKTLPTGGRTPLPHALQTAIQLLTRFDQINNYNPVLIILTDGKANVSLPGGGDAWMQTLALADRISKLNIQSVVLNTDLNYLNLNRAKELATSIGGQYLSLSDISKEQLTPIVNQFV
ncbi:magnesium chelatase subunit D family protein [Mucilaginibacter aquaedulcis]|uniref:magnesium chelatase subunit D family protein n=1 Tax=Mucilaginibacter aquaedulcis TaxID=1187081 RepID=UPI0025B4AF4D|nr:magnesium chelatase subunit D family protein [Mucilaginibacter aquaedulcis]MDN3548216.1 magnesium chelatase subunit D family protein [Mucilaginibacter aquaedulcis]